MKSQPTSADNLIGQEIHQLRNDLLAITLYSSSLVSKADEEGAESEPAVKILEAARQMRQRIDELSLVYSSHEKSPVPINPDQEITQILASDDFPRPNEVQLTQSLSGGDSQISLPRKAVRAILLHLLKNAFAATRNTQQQAQVGLTTGVAGNYWFLKVSDNGVGISSFPETPGVGFTLISILAESYHGKIAFGSEGTGSRITVSFPQL